MNPRSAFAAHVPTHKTRPPWRFEQARLLAAMEGYSRFALTHPHLFELMFSPLYCDYQNAGLPQAARASYAVLAEISPGLDWDKADATDSQRRGEMMLWSLVHGYAKLRLAGQFMPQTPAGAAFDIADIIPDFGYRADPADAKNPLKSA